MKFIELIDLRPCIKVADLIQLFLLGYDDKIYLSLENTDGDEYLINERIISEKWQPYYECEVHHLADYCDSVNFTIVIK